MDNNSPSSPLLLSRRQVLTGIAGAAATLVLPKKPAFAEEVLPWNEVRKLRFSHTHTGEKMDITYFAGGDYVPEGLERANYLLRDHRNNQEKNMDPKLLDQMIALQRTLGSEGTFEIISGYRSPETNRMLRRRSRNVAKKSFHLKGQAIDIRLTDVDLQTLRSAAVEMHAGGVGIYRGADFLHLDTGPERTWG